MTMGRSFFTAAQFGMTDTVRLRYSARREKNLRPGKTGKPGRRKLDIGWAGVYHKTKRNISAGRETPAPAASRGRVCSISLNSLRSSEADSAVFRPTDVGYKYSCASSVFTMSCSAACREEES